MTVPPSRIVVDSGSMLIEEEEMEEWEMRISALSWVGVMRAYNEALRQAYKEDKTKKLVWTTQRDPSVCFICVTMDGTVFNISETAGLIPAHPLCRCNWTPAEEVE